MLLPFQLGTLPSGSCFTTEQQRYNAYMSITYAILNGMAFYNFGPDKPAVENQAFPWLRTTDGRWYMFNGVWRSPVNYSPYERRWFEGTLTQLQSYDGGDGTANPPSATSGPMWVEDIAFQGRSPMGPGDIPTANPAKTLSVGENIGEGAHAQTLEELHPHQHEADPITSDTFLGHAKPGQGILNVGSGGDTSKFALTAAAGGNADGDAEPSPIIHPSRGLYCIQWSGRTNYTVP